MSDTQKQEPVQFVPPSQIDPAELAKALIEDGVVEAPAAAAPAPVTAAPASAPVAAEPVKTVEEAPKAKEELPALLRIAKERDAFRKEQESAKPYMEAIKALPPERLQAVVKAIQSGDLVGLIAASGGTHAQYNAQLLGAPEKVAKEEAKVESSGNAEVDAIRQELAELRRERDTEKMQTTRSQVLGQMKTVLKDNPKFSTINGLGDLEGVERELLEYHRIHGSMPGETFEESIHLAAEVHEARLRKEAEKWRAVLTPAVPSAVVPSRAPESPSTGTVTTRTLTNANTSAPAAVSTVPKTRQEILDAIASGRFEDLEA